MAGFFDVIIIAGPSVKSGILEGASKTESEGPGVGAVFDDCGKVTGSLLWGLTAGEKDDTSEIFGNMVFEGFGGFHANFFRGGRRFILFASDDHIDFEDTGFKINLVVI